MRWTGATSSFGQSTTPRSIHTGEQKTTRRTRRNLSVAFKAKLALAALKGKAALVELAKRFEVRAHQIPQWKEQLLGALHRCLAPAFRPSGN